MIPEKAPVLLRAFSQTTHRTARKARSESHGAGLVAGCAGPLWPHLSACAAEAAGSRILIVFFSRTGNSREVAGQIPTCAGGDMPELKTAHAYPEACSATTAQAKREQEEHFRPSSRRTWKACSLMM